MLFSSVRARLLAVLFLAFSSAVLCTAIFTFSLWNSHETLSSVVDLNKQLRNLQDSLEISQDVREELREQNTSDDEILLEKLNVLEAQLRLILNLNLISSNDVKEIGVFFTKYSKSTKIEMVERALMRQSVLDLEEVLRKKEFSYEAKIKIYYQAVDSQKHRPLKWSIFLIVLFFSMSNALGYFLLRRFFIFADNHMEAIQGLKNKKYIEIIDPYGDELAQISKSFNKNIQVIAAKDQELERSNKDLSAFAYTVGHDLRAPLRHIDKFLNLLWSELEEEGLSDQQKEYRAYIQGSVKKASSMLEDLLDFSQIDAKLLKESIVISREIEKIFSNYEDSKGVFSIVGEKGLTLPFVPSLFVALCENLISNGVKYSSPDNVRIEVSIRKFCDEPFAEIIFSDRGIGIPGGMEDRVFKLFQRLSAKGLEVSGTGSGLAIVKRIVERHDGEIRLENRSGGGTSFILKLPL